MKIEYKILWLDDQIQDFIDDEIIEEIEEYLAEQGFDPMIVTTSRSEEFFNLLDDSFDLLMTDYHLNDMNGDEVIKKVRSQEYSVMSEVLFYTAKADLKDTDKISRVSFLETNTLLGDHRDLVLRATKSLIALTIKKFHNIVSMRGMVMHETAHLDEIIFDLVKSVVNPEIDQDIIDCLFDEIEGFYRSKHKLVEKLRRNNRYDKVFSDPLLFTFTQRANVLSMILDKKGESNFISDFKAEVIQVRNQFAHAVLDEELKIFRTRNGIVFNDETCKKLRKDIKKHKEHIDRLSSVIYSSGDSL